MSLPSDPAAPARTALVTGLESPHGRAAAAALRGAGWTVEGLDPTTLRGAGGDGGGAATEAVAALPAADALILAAGEPEPVPFAEIPFAAWAEMIDLHLRAAHDACRAVLPGMIERGGGAIVAITPSSALNGTAAGHHAAAATAVIGLVKALAREVGPRGVIVNAVAPGPMDGDPAGLATPLGRGLAAAELGETVRYLAEERHYFAGSVLAPNGGSHL